VGVNRWPQPISLRAERAGDATGSVADVLVVDLLDDVENGLELTDLLAGFGVLGNNHPVAIPELPPSLAGRVLALRTEDAAVLDLVLCGLGATTDQVRHQLVFGIVAAERIGAVIAIVFIIVCP
jgi:hypothetical protein